MTAKLTPVASESAPTERKDARNEANGRYRELLVNTLLRHATKRGEVAASEVHQEMQALTGASLATVRNWFHYRATVPDIVSIARMQVHWKIPPSEILPENLHDIFSGESSTRDENKAPATAAQFTTPVSLYGGASAQAVDKALGGYTASPQSTIFISYEGTDMANDVRPGEMVLVDTSIEEIAQSGMYLLRITDTATAAAQSATRDQVCIRHIDKLMREPAVRLSTGRAARSADEIIALPLPDHIQVLGRIVAVLHRC